MKNVLKKFGLVALVAVIGFSFAALSLTGCDDGSGGPGGGGGGTGGSNGSGGGSGGGGTGGGGTGGGTGGGGSGGGTGGGGTGGGGTGGGTGTPNTSLNGVWAAGNQQVTVNGSTGTLSAYDPENALWQNAVDKGFVYTGMTWWKNITSTGNLTWSGEQLGIRYYTNNPNVAVQTDWTSGTFTISANGQTLTFSSSDSSGAFTNTYTRVQ